MNEQFYYIIAVIALIILLLSLFTRKIEKSFLSEPLVAMLLGFVLNLSGIPVFEISKKVELIHLSSQFTIIVALISTAFRIPHKSVIRYRKDFTWIIVTGMIGMWILAAGIIYIVFGFHFIYCLLIGAIISPTDPVVISSIVSGESIKKLIPSKVRYAISFESGANDGLAYLMVMLSFFLLTLKTSIAWKEFGIRVLLWENVSVVFLGGLIGYYLGKMAHRFHQKREMSRKAFLGFSVSVAFFVYALSEVLNMNGIIGVFAAGVMMNSGTTDNEEMKQEKIPETLERLFVIPVFFLFGLIVPYKSWLILWKPLLIVLFLFFTLKRIPVIILLRTFLKRTYSFMDFLLIGWFGPVGVAALFYTALITQKMYFEELWPLVSFVIFGSTVVHGITRYYVSKWYASFNREHDGS